MTFFIIFSISLSRVGKWNGDKYKSKLVGNHNVQNIRETPRRSHLDRPLLQSGSFILLRPTNVYLSNNFGLSNSQYRARSIIHGAKQNDNTHHLPWTVGHKSWQKGNAHVENHSGKKQFGRIVLLQRNIHLV